MADSLRNLGMLALANSDYDAARSLSQHSLEIYHVLGDKIGMATLWAKWA